MNLYERIHEDGVAVRRDFVRRDELDALDRALSAARVAELPRSRQVLYTHRSPPPDAPPFTALMDQWLNPHRFAGEASTAGVAKRIAHRLSEEWGRSLVLFQDLFLLKRQGQRPFPWHQDRAFWPVDRAEGLILWVPLRASNGSSGALKFATGSHLLGEQPVLDLHTGAPQDPDAKLSFQSADWPELAPVYGAGDAVVFSPLVFHASPAMKAPGERAAWSCIFLGAETRWCHAAAPNHPMCKVVPDGALVKETLHD